MILTLSSYKYYYELHIYVFSNKLPEELAKTPALNENNCEGGKNRAPQWQQSSVKKWNLRNITDVDQSKCCQEITATIF